MIEGADGKGAFRPDQTILEPTSGKTDISLGMICRHKSCDPDNVAPERTRC